MVQQCANNDIATLIFCFEVSHCFAPFLLLSSCHRWYSSHCDLLWYSEAIKRERVMSDWSSLLTIVDFDSSNVMSRQAGKGNECRTQTLSILTIENPQGIGCSLVEVRKSTHMSTIFSALCFLVDCPTQLISIDK